MPIGAIVGSTVVGGAVSMFGAKKAADAQEAAAKSATKQQNKQYQQAREDLSPYRDTGKSALYSLADMFGLATPDNPEGGQAFSESSLEAFRNSPDYQVAMKEGIAAHDKSAAARGGLLSGGAVREVTELGADIGSRYFGSYLDRLASVAGMGQNAAAGSASHAMDHGSSLSKMALAGGEAKAAGYAGMANNFTGAMNTGLNNYMTYSGWKAGGSTAV